MVEKKVNFIVIGAMKAATTSLDTYLKQHPDIFMTKVKEPMFFNNFNQNKDYKLLQYQNILRQKHIKQISKISSK